MTTSLSSRSLACNSYSIVTSQSSPFSFGQQLTGKRKKINEYLDIIYKLFLFHYFFPSFIVQYIDIMFRNIEYRFWRGWVFEFHSSYYVYQQLCIKSLVILVIWAISIQRLSFKFKFSKALRNSNIWEAYFVSQVHWEFPTWKFTIEIHN